MNTLIKHIDTWHNSLTDTAKSALDLLLHYLIAYAILLNLGGLTYYLGNICKELFIYAALLALLMIPIRLLAVYLIVMHKRDKYIKNILREILYSEQPTTGSIKNQNTDDDDDDWFMKIAKG